MQGTPKSGKSEKWAWVLLTVPYLTLEIFQFRKKRIFFQIQIGLKIRVLYEYVGKYIIMPLAKYIIYAVPSVTFSLHRAILDNTHNTHKQYLHSRPLAYTNIRAYLYIAEQKFQNLHIILNTKILHILRTPTQLGKESPI
jgi:hypothetical protein